VSAEDAVAGNAEAGVETTGDVIVRTFTVVPHHMSMLIQPYFCKTHTMASLKAYAINMRNSRFFALDAGRKRSRTAHNLTVLAILISASTAFAQPIKQSFNSTSSLPTLGESSQITPAAERRIGDHIAASIYRDPDYIDDPVLVDYLQSIWLPLMAAARARGELNAELEDRFSWQIFLIRDRTVNAFALPGGFFGVHLGLISTVSSRDELAAVLGHELSHVTQRHIARLITQQSQQTPWMVGAMILGALALSKNPQAGSAAIVGGQALAAQNQLNFSRDMEREADRVGFGVMLDAGFEGSGVASMFDKLQQASRLNDNGAFPYLRTHPLNTQRIAEAQSRLQLAAQNVVPASASSQLDSAQALVLHAMMASRARVLADPGIDVLHAMLTDAERRGVSELPRATRALRLYAGALAAAKLRDYSSAQTLVAQLQALVAGHPLCVHAVRLLQTEIDMLAGTGQARQISLGSAKTRADTLLASRALLTLGRGEEVSDRLQVWVADHPDDALAWQLLSQAYGRQNQRIRAVRADAEAHVAQLDYIGALDRLRAAQGLMRSDPGSGDFIEGSIIDARARQVDSLVKEQALQDKINR
jgi:predicted Zn-dependent protease